MRNLIGWKRNVLLQICLLSLSLSGAVHAQQLWPAKPVLLIIPAALGGTTDAFARVVTRKMGENLQQPFILESRPGAGGMIGAQRVSKAEPDGYTLLTSGTLQLGAQHSGGENSLAFDQIKGFTHLAYFGGAPYVLVVHPSLPAKDIKSFIAHAATTRDGLNWASTGVGSQAHLLGEIFRNLTKVNMVHIPFAGAAPALNNLLGNQISAAIVSVGSASGFIKSGALRAIAITSTVRMPSFPDLPTFAEQGHPQITGAAWFGLSGPPGMSPPLVQKINQEVQRALASPEVQKFMTNLSIVTTSMDSAEYSQFIASEIARFAPK